MDASEDLQELGARIRAARAYAGLEQDELAARLETSLSTLKRWEYGQEGKRGRSRFQRKAMIEGVAEVCGLPHEWFEIDFNNLDGGPSTDELFGRMEKMTRDLVRAVTRQFNLQSKRTQELEARLERAIERLEEAKPRKGSQPTSETATRVAR